MSTTFKLDPASLPKLSAKGDNFSEWKPSWTLAFKYAELWNIVSEKTTRPQKDGDEQDNWDKQNTKAMVMLLSSVHQDLTITVTTHEDVAKSWKTLAERFDRDTGNSSIYLFRRITSLRHQDGSNLQDHIDEFHLLWVKMQKKCSTSK